MKSSDNPFGITSKYQPNKTNPPERQIQPHKDPFNPANPRSPMNPLNPNSPFNPSSPWHIKK